MGARGKGDVTLAGEPGPHNPNDAEFNGRGNLKWNRVSGSRELLCRIQMNENPESLARFDDASLRSRLDPVRQRPPGRIPASTWVLLGAAVVFFWAYASVNQRRAALDEAHAEAVVDERLRNSMPLPEPSEGEVASVDGEWAGPEVFTN